MDDIFIFKADTKDSQEIRKRGLGGDNFKKSGINESEFQNFFSKLVTKKMIQDDIKDTLFFLIELTEKISSQLSQEMLDFFKFNVRSVLDSQKIFVSIEKTGHFQDRMINS
ncbi:MAG: hypothetical protein RBG13Loki_1451 [Promethearchaeota archaeon CR_4]|nr:MAG: hypothetical protein RBG13Loki_1451 [Candidatus Lokiarchaeota archaeon CR_4]